MEANLPFAQFSNFYSSHLTLVNFVKGMIGSGILTLPIVFRQAGLWTAFGLVFLFGFLNTLTMATLVRCAHHLVARRRDSSREKEETIKKGGGGDKCHPQQQRGEPMNYGQVMEAALVGSFEWARPWAQPAKFVRTFFLMCENARNCFFQIFCEWHNCAAPNGHWMHQVRLHCGPSPRG
jgi:hypothetical protein